MTKDLNIYIETYGCQMNEYDSELVASIVANKGYAITPSEREADVILLNTCAVREHAHLRIYGRLQELKRLKAMKQNSLTIGILGCMAQNLKDTLLDSHEEIDFIAGPDSYRELPRLIERARIGGEKGAALRLSRKEAYTGVNPLRSGGVNAWVAVMRGCDNMCTFCVVPYTRGRERSRDPFGVVEEVNALAKEGYRQVTLLGQNVNSYSYDKYGFADLVKMVADVPDIYRVRFTSPHPKDFPDALVRVIAEHPKVCGHIHLPLQAGNNRVLDLMKRTCTIESFEDLVQKIRKGIPEISLTTDVIVGFPTETDDEYEDTFHAMERIRFDAAFIFKYSERKGTHAAKHFKDDVPAEKKTERIVRLVELQKRITGEINQQFVGRTLEVLVEDSSIRDKSLAVGRTDGFKNAIFPKNGLALGELVDVRIERAKGGTLYGSAVAA
ncbi:MAG: tRNA (N6-isopentenyl adenosine(37)-C2)-methylthiotransferase MiaB [Candidatus Latescibacteria bacterium]|nr:tRNA (N6-isopentenyl adenosine(37)-C2)-methylthiotransferase MiaB [Candidatus Latescibacterota bacterium]NIO28348.1 tRNA (N6-isopentenyl adenosine(37)-C2)-methylthiotransferase MiaB [Candidatus Latescibacterota bacterium]NIO55896.1 tRNA (N6-isopentenyl adenosine(37)-C2)-methylthiotransferase MiaB [Candidatus Latescibacterota bacterium]NIT01861.1 tRNA (N6-isopentenyl adenosine(37)-C2)-methylthiotransferase MiaB [Candidatus Latescibacterota bacterium]